MFTIKELPQKYHPMGRLKENGFSSLSSLELLAVVIGGEKGYSISVELFAQFGNLISIINAPDHELLKTEGLGRQTITRIKAILTLSGRMIDSANEGIKKICSPADAAALLMPNLSKLDQEEMHIILLNTRNEVLGIKMVYRGSLNTCVCRPAELVKFAILANAAAVIVAHNHPSGNPSPPLRI